MPGKSQGSHDAGPSSAAFPGLLAGSCPALQWSSQGDAHYGMLASQVAAYYAPVLVLFLLNVYRSFTLQLLFRNVGVLIAWVLVCCAHEELGAQPRRVCKAEVVF